MTTNTRNVDPGNPPWDKPMLENKNVPILNHMIKTNGLVLKKGKKKKNNKINILLKYSKEYMERRNVVEAEKDEIEQISDPPIQLENTFIGLDESLLATQLNSNNKPPQLSLLDFQLSNDENEMQIESDVENGMDNDSILLINNQNGDNILLPKSAELRGNYVMVNGGVIDISNSNFDRNSNSNGNNRDSLISNFSQELRDISEYGNNNDIFDDDDDDDVLPIARDNERDNERDNQDYDVLPNANDNNNNNNYNDSGIKTDVAAFCTKYRLNSTIKKKLNKIPMDMEDIPFLQRKDLETRYKLTWEESFTCSRRFPKYIDDTSNNHNLG
eukprot:715042_1